MKEKMIYCNKCGQPICIETEEAQVDYLKIDKNWGYFSGKDGVKHQVNLCEDCYDSLIEEFQIPPEKSEVTELL